MLKFKIILTLLVTSYSLSCSSQIMRKRTTTLMGSRFDFTVIAADSLTAEDRIDDAIAEIARIEELISDWKADSEISQVNRNAGIRPVTVSPEVYALTQRAIRLSEMTQGAFDISFAAMDRIWKFDGTMNEIPSPEAIKKSVQNVGYRNILLNSVQSTIFLKLHGMKIGFGSIGKGYAADRARTLLESKGVAAGIVNASGDIAAWGKQPNNKPWDIGITNPFDVNDLIAVLPLNREAVTTSGNYEKFVIFKGKRYSHIINPTTGYPATGLVSVTVVGPDAELANGFSTSIMVLGQKAGLQLINQYPDYSCVLITDSGRIKKSRHFDRRIKMLRVRR